MQKRHDQSSELAGWPSDLALIMECERREENKGRRRGKVEPQDLIKSEFSIICEPVSEGELEEEAGKMGGRNEITCNQKEQKNHS